MLKGVPVGPILALLDDADQSPSQPEGGTAIGRKQPAEWLDLSAAATLSPMTSRRRVCSRSRSSSALASSSGSGPSWTSEATSPDLILVQVYAPRGALVRGFSWPMRHWKADIWPLIAGNLTERLVELQAPTGSQTLAGFDLLGRRCALTPDVTPSPRP